MKVLDREKFRGTLLQPLGSRGSLALRAMTVAARVVRDAAISAGVAFLNMASEFGCAAESDVTQHPLLF
jgi:hypothetical protein